MMARAVEAAGSDFSPMGRAMHDAGVALDEISSLSGNMEPVVLRVRAAGGSAAERLALAGDWLCADHEPPRRIRRPEWTLSLDAAAWASRREWLEAWELCEDSRWALHEAAAVGVDRRLLALAACACARTSLHFAGGDGGRSAALIDATEAWARGEAKADVVLRLSDFALADSYPIGGAGAAAFAARAAGFAADAVADPAAAALAAASASSAFAADELALDDDGGTVGAAAFERHVAYLADVVRGSIPTVSVLKAALLSPPPA